MAARSVTIVAISQNEAKDTAAFVKQYGITHTCCSMTPRTYPVSNAYGLTNVPTIFWIAPDGEIEISSVGWSRADVAEIGQKAAAGNSQAPTPLFEPDEQVPEFPRWLRVEKLARSLRASSLQ